MTSTESRWRPGNPWAAARASLIPWAAFLIAAAAADTWVHHELSATGLAAAAPLYLGFVALPAMVPLVVARAGATRAGVLVGMTAVATISAVLVVTTDDAQAGLAVLWVPFVAIPLATVVWIGQVVAARRNRTPDPAGFSLASTSDRLAALVIRRCRPRRSSDASTDGDESRQP